MNKIATFTLTALVAVGAASAAAAQQPTPMDTARKAAPAYQQSSQSQSYQRTVPESLFAQVRISEDSARGLALAKVPNGAIQTLVLHRARGKLLWSFTIKNPRKSGNTEVTVNAMDGTIVSTEQKAS